MLNETLVKENLHVDVFPSLGPYHPRHMVLLCRNFYISHTNPQFRNSTKAWEKKMPMLGMINPWRGFDLDAYQNDCKLESVADMQPHSGGMKYCTNKYTYTHAYEQCLEWDDRLHSLPCSLLNFSSLVHAMHMEYLNSHFPQIIWVYSNLIHSYTSNNHNPMTTSNLMLYLQHNLIF